MYYKLFGWKPIDPKIIKLLDQSFLDRSIMLYPHTSGWDIISVLIYVLSYPQWYQKFHVFIRDHVPSKFWARTIMPHYLIPVPCPPPDRRSNIIQKCIAKYRNKEKFKFFISPEGAIEHPVPWKSGYLALAVELNLPIVVIGFDFSVHTIVATAIVEHEGTKVKISYLDDRPSTHLELREKTVEEMKRVVEPYLVEAMGRIAPLHPDRSYAPTPFKEGDLVPIPTYFYIGLVIGIVIVLLLILGAVIYYLVRR